MKGMSGLFAALGLVGIAFALISFVIAILSGPLFASDLGWIGTNLVLGIVLLVSSAALNWGSLRDRMSSGEARRAGKYGGSALLGTFVAIAILGMLGFLATRYSTRFDWSEAGIHTLSDQSQKLLGGLDADVQVTALVSKLEEPPLRDLLDKYAHASPHFKVEYADPNTRPGLIEQFGVTPDQLGQGGLVRLAIGENAVNVNEVDENKLTNALVKLTRTGEKVVYFLEGHGERAIEGEEGKARDGYGLAAEALRNENYTVNRLLLASQGEVPADADAVVVAGVRRPLLDVERQALDGYLARGGSLLVSIDPRVHTDLVQQVEVWGATLGDDVVIDRRQALFGRAMSPFAAGSPDHEITKNLRDPALFHEVRSVKARPGFTEIVFTGEDSWGETDLALLDAEGKAALDPADTRGPVPVAVAGRPTAAAVPPAGDNAPKDPRMVVFGDADFASNEFLDAYSNRDLFVNSVNWLVGDVEAISIRPPQSRASRSRLTGGEQFRSLRSLSLFVLPEAIAVLAVFTWWSRRHSKR